MTKVDEDVDKQRSAIKSLVRQSVDGSLTSNTFSPRRSLKPVTTAPVLSPLSQRKSNDQQHEEESVRPSVPQLRRLSSASDSPVMALTLDNQSDVTTLDEREDDAYDEDLGVQQWINTEFVYSKEVEEAIKKIRQRRNRKRQFRQSDVHIFNLPQIIATGTPRLPFTPSVHRDLPKLQLPEPLAFEKTRKAKKKKKQYTEDEFGVYLNSWQRGQLGINPDLIQNTSKIFNNTQDEDD